MLTLERLLEEVDLWHGEFTASYPDQGFINTIANPWFEDIAPDRARAYGVMGLNELGEKGVVAQLFNCYLRWKTAEDGEDWWGIHWDNFRDAFGYAVLMAVVNGVSPLEAQGWPWERWAESSPMFQYEVLKKEAWLSSRYGTVAEDSFKLALGMYEVSKKRCNAR